MERIKIVALMGKAGSGKDTLLKEVIAAMPDRFHEIVSCTTRPPREGEQEGVNYFFLSVEEFTKRLLNGDLLEATEFNDWHYGTLVSTLAADKTNIGVFNPEGVRCLQDNPSIDLEVFYIISTDKERLLRQLNRENSPNVSEIIRRYGVDNEDFADLEDDIDFISFINEVPEDKARFLALIGQMY